MLALSLISISLAPTACVSSLHTHQWDVTEKPVAARSLEPTLPPITGDPADYIRRNFVKAEHLVPMRDGVRLHTTVYSPLDSTRTYPILMIRTPYDCAPYGDGHYPGMIGPGRHLLEDGYIYVHQDVRGCYMSEGQFVDMRPHIDRKESPIDVDESSDCYDTIAWLLENVTGHNGRVGMWGISYPGFYAAAGMIDAHPALKAVSPQAPIADWFFDDFHHHGAVFLPHAFNFMASFGKPRPEPTAQRRFKRFDHGTPDGYQFFMDLGPLSNANDRHLKGGVPIWNDMVAHPNYDGYWQARNLLPHLNRVAPAVMTVGGWFDAEDLYGPLKIYRSIEDRNPDVDNVLVMGPWQHGGWTRTDGDHLGNVDFGGNTSELYQRQIERAFFNHYLRGDGTGGAPLPEATVFETGTNQWRQFDRWPPAEIVPKALYVHAAGQLAFDGPTESGDAAADAAFDEFISDPAKPVPFTEEITTGMTREYMTDDQRFAARRPDVLVWRTPPLDARVTLAGPITADLWVSTDRTAADWIVKVIDVFPPDAENPTWMGEGRHMGGYQMMVRSEVIRGRFRDSYAEPKPFTPNQPTRIKLELQDVLHTFKPGHRIMVQVQSTWFPLVDRNPQTYVDNIFEAKESDFVKATHRVYRNPRHASCLRVTVLE
jgi:hypothetical protein